MTQAVTPPTMSSHTRRLLDEAADRDRRLIVVTGGYTLADIRALVAESNDADIERLVADGLKWRHYWQPGCVAWRQELEDRERARINIEISHDLSGTCHWGSAVGPTHRELAALRAQPAWVNTCVHGDCRWQETVYDPARRVLLCPAHRAAVDEGKAAA